MKIKLLKDKYYKFGVSLAKGEVRERFKETNGLWQIEANEFGSDIWLTVERNDFEFVLVQII